jgi:dipeptidyl aminopeptidase/acylaminoacyl peptidase
MNEAKPEALEKREKDRDDARVVDKDERFERVWLLDVKTRRLLQATAGPWQIDQIEWMPDGRSLIALANDKPQVDAWLDRLYRIDLEHPADGTFHEIAAPRGPLGNLAVSPDGQTIAYIGARVDGPESHDLFLQPIKAGTAQNITHATIDRPLNQVRWIDDQSLAVHVQRGFKSTLAVVNRGGKPVFDSLDVNPSAYARSKTGTVAFVGETATKAPELYVRTSSSKPRAVTAFNQQWSRCPSSLRNSSPTRVSMAWKSRLRCFAPLRPVPSPEPPGPSPQSPSLSSSTAARPDAGPTASKRGDNCWRNAATP